MTSVIWAPGTLAAAAFTPVLVALLKEMLFKPVEVVTRAVPVRGVVRSASSASYPEEHHETPEEIETRIAQPGEAPGSSRPGRRRHAWQVAVVTGLCGFILAAVIITVPEVVSGNSLFGGGRDTTLFSGKKSDSSTPADTTTTTTPTDTTETVPPASTVTVPPAAETITVPPPAPSTTLPQEEVEPAQPDATPEEPATPP